MFAHKVYIRANAVKNLTFRGYFKMTQWNLDDIVSVQGFDALYAEAEKDIARIGEFHAKLSPQMPAEDFQAYIAFDNAADEKMSRLGHLPHLIESTDQTSQQAKLLQSRFEELQLKAANASRPISHWLIGKEVAGMERLDDENAARLFSAVPKMQYSLQRGREAEKYILSMPEEKIITEKGMNGIDVLTSLRDFIATEFEFKFKPKGAEEERIIKTESEIRALVPSPDADIREEAYRSMNAKYGENLMKFFMVYQAVVKDWVTEAKNRGYSSSISRRNHKNNVPDKAIETLLDVCSANTGIFQRYFRFKAKEIGMEKLRRCDIYAPLEKQEAEKTSYEDAVKMVLETLSNFSESFSEKARQILDAGHVDVYPKEAKRSGAFCSTVAPSIVPYVLLNFTGKPRDVATLAHEIGHGIHSLYAAHLPISGQQPPLPLAETASTFSELLMFERIFEEAKDGNARKTMLVEKISDSFATTIRQNYFVKFELEAHKAIPAGVTPDKLCEIYMETLKEQFGDAVDVDPSFKVEWASIPHIVHAPFYCYAYSFGDLLSTALFAMYKNEGKAFVPKMEKILAYGGSESPEKILAEVGIDMCSREFWQAGFDVVSKWQEQLEGYCRK